MLLLVAAFLIGTAAADHEWSPSSSKKATWLEHVASFERAAETEVMNMVDGLNTTLAVRSDVADVVMISGIMVDDPHPKASPLFVSSDMAQLGNKTQIIDEGPHEIEMPRIMPRISSEFPTKSKVTLLLFNMFLLGQCGVDRCYMGSICCGVSKALTFGGLGVWTLIDWFAIWFNAIGRYDSMDILGFHAEFPENDVTTAFWIAFFSGIPDLAIPILFCCCCACCFASAASADDPGPFQFPRTGP